MNEEVLYSGEISFEVYEDVSEAVEEFSTEWVDAEADLVLEENGEYRLRVDGPETVSLLKPWKTHEASETYTLEEETAEYLRQTFSE
jgi:hypothetical protein